MNINFVEDFTPGDPDNEGLDSEGENDEASSIGSGGDGEADAVSAEPPCKKPKRDLAKEAENELKVCDEIVQDSSISFDEKCTKLATFLESLITNSVNTLQFETDFANWTRKILLTLLNELTETSVPFFNFLCVSLKVAPTIFEPILEKLLSVIYTSHDFTEECDHAFGVFMENLARTFEKLRRFPKLIAKLLLCIRNNITSIPATKVKGGKSKKRKPKTLQDRTSFILPKPFLEACGPILSILPMGQSTDLWKTLHHNLEEEYIKKCTTDPNSTSLDFLSIVVELIIVFLYNIKIVDYLVPNSSGEKVILEMMSKLNLSLHELGKQTFHSDTTGTTGCFIRLASAYAHVHQFMITYSEIYEKQVKRDEIAGSLIQAEDLSVLLPFLTSQEWVSLWNLVEKDEDLINSQIMVSLVALKLKQLAIINQRRKSEDENLPPSNEDDDDKHIKNLQMSGSDNDNDKDGLLQRSLKEAAKFVWCHRHLLLKDENCLMINSEDSLASALVYMENEELIDNAKSYVESQVISSEIASDATVDGMSNFTFLTAITLESLHDALKKIGKMNLMKHFAKKIVRECYSSSCKVEFLEEVKKTGNKLSLSSELQSCLKEAVQIVNECVTEKMMKKEKDEREEEVESMQDLLKQVLSLLANQKLEHFPKIVKTMIILSSLLIFTAVIGQTEFEEIVELLSRILHECDRNSQGNEFLFHVKWTELFGVVMYHNAHLSERASEIMCTLILENIYLSPKLAANFRETHFDTICANLDFSESSGCLSLSVFDFIVKEAVGPKSKSTPLLLSHLNDLAVAAVSKLSNGTVIADLHSIIRKQKKILKKKRRDEVSPTKKIDQPNFFVSRVMRTCYLLLKGKSFMNSDVMSDYQVIVLPYLHFAVDFLEVGKDNICKTGGYENLKMEGVNEMTTPLFTCLQFLNECLKSFEEFRSKLAQGFLRRVWDCSFEMESITEKEASNLERNRSKLNLLSLILKVSNEEEFQSICDSLVQRTENQSDINVVAEVLNCLIEIEISDEKKKQSRRVTIEQCLFKYLEHIHVWREANDFVKTAFPYIQFQTQLLRRRKPMGSVNTLAMCFASITSLPFYKIEDIETFKKAFSVVCDLLNALIFHRLDVLSFRTHIFLQCFQFLLECLVKRADQRNKLTDREIYDLRHCGHNIERICQSAKGGKKEFARVSPYLIVVLLQQFEKITVYPVVKTTLLNGCYKLLDMCDDQGISHINSMLSPGSREIFKATYELYKKFYRYKGKV